MLFCISTLATADGMGGSSSQLEAGKRELPTNNIKAHFKSGGGNMTMWQRVPPTAPRYVRLVGKGMNGDIIHFHVPHLCLSPVL